MAEETKATVADDMRQRRTFYPRENRTALEQAQEYLAASIERFADFNEYPFAAPGVDVDDSGDTVFDSEIYSEDVGIIIGTLRGVVGREDGKDVRGIKAIFMAPTPDVPTMLSEADEALTKWATSILEKEINHVAVRPLRDAEDVTTVVDQMPTNVDAYTTSGRGIGAGIMVAFNELYKAINATLAEKVTSWRKSRLIKSELKRCMESSAYALEYQPALEDRGENDSLFVIALNMGIGAAKKKGLDPTIFERWLATRDQKAFTPADEEDEDDLDLDSLTEDLLGSESDEEEAEATEETEAA